MPGSIERNHTNSSITIAEGTLNTAVSPRANHVGDGLPLTQNELADTLALSLVHVNRMLMEMRRAGLVTFQNKQLTIHDLQALQSASGFNASYLHLDGDRH